jgi:hypothetical protein
MDIDRLASIALTVALLAAGTPAAAQAPPPTYLFDQPAGWSRTDREGTIFLVPPAGPAGGAVVMILSSIPRQADFEGQFRSLWTGFESGLGLRNRREEALQRATGPGFEKRMHYALYSGDQGDRYLAVMTRADGPAVGTVLLLATTPLAYDRLRDVAADLFNGMRLSAPQAGGLPAPGAAPATRLPAGPAPRPASYRGSGIVGVWAGTRIMRSSGGGYHSEIAIPAWYVFFDDGQFLQTFPDEGLAGFDREAHRVRFPAEWQAWRFDGTTGVILRQEGAAPWALKLIDPDRLEVNQGPFLRCKDVDGLRLHGTWYQRSGEDAEDPDFTRRPRGRRPLIRFTRDGRFDDEGLFAVAMPSRTGGDDRPGAGTYEVKDFSITLRYDDGRVRQEAFPGRGAALTFTAGADDRIFIRGVGLLRR